MAIFSGFFLFQAVKPASDAGSDRVDLVRSLPRVALETSVGTLIAEVDIAAAPKTASNFLRYVDEGAYDGGQFHRTVTPGNQPNSLIRIGVIQGSKRKDAREHAPIPLERTTVTGLRHLDGALSMARDGADSAQDEFFICIGDQPELDYGGRRNPDGQGFAVFGRLISGWLVVRQIQAAPASGQSLTPVISVLRARRL